MTNQDLEESLRLGVQLILTVATRMPAQQFKAWLCGGIITNIVGQLPEDYWHEMLKQLPCDQAGCDCHLLHGKTMSALQDLRDDWTNHVPRSFSA